MIHAMEAGSDSQVSELKQLSSREGITDKVNKVLQIFRECGVDKWAFDLKEKYIADAFKHLDEIAVLSSRKEPLKELAHNLVQREY